MSFVYFRKKYFILFINMGKINKDFNTFFIELASNNNKDWFDKNRDRYQNSVKIPFENLIQSVVEEIQKEVPDFEVDVRKSIWRINRDIRWRTDKTPYKLTRSAFISRYGRKDNRPGLYLQVGPEKVRIGGGIFSPEKDELIRIREYIAQNPKALAKAINDKRFKEVFGVLKGQENKRLTDPFLVEAAVREPLIFRKQFYYMEEFPPEYVTRPDLVNIIVDHWRAAKPVSDFLMNAIS